MTIRGYCSPYQFLVSQVNTHCEEESYNIKFCVNIYSITKTVNHHSTYSDLFAGSHLLSTQKIASECYVTVPFC